MKGAPVGGYYWGEYVVPDQLATAEELVAYLGKQVEAPAANATLQACTRLVLTATQGAFYDADPATGLATDPATAGALRKATLIQAAAWVSLAIDPFAGGVPTPKVKLNAGLGTARVQYAGVEAAAAARAAAMTHLVPDALLLLQSRNLLGTGPWTFG